MKNLKKIVLFCVAILILGSMTGCTKEKLNLEKVRDAVDTLKGKEVSYISAIDALVNSGLFGEDLTDVYQLSEVGISEKNILEEEGNTKYWMAITEKGKDGFSYFIGRPAEGKKDALKKELDTYYKSAKEKGKLRVEEADDCLIYLVSSDNEKAWNLYQENRYVPLFSMVGDIDESQLESILGLKKDDVEEYIIKMPMAIVSAESYMVIKPAKGKKDTVKDAMKTYLENQEQQWSTYLPDQYELVKGRLEKEIGDYLVYIISKDNNRVLDAIENCKE